MTPPSTKTLKHWVCGSFFFICCSTFSLILNMRLRLGFLKCSPQVRVLSTLVHLPRIESFLTTNTSLIIFTCTVIHHNGTQLPKTYIRKTFDIVIILYLSKMNNKINYQSWYHSLNVTSKYPFKRPNIYFMSLFIITVIN